jgi:hypothetical protein
MMIVVDGRAKFDCSLSEFYHQPLILGQIARQGVTLPVSDDLAGQEYRVQAQINAHERQARWVVQCPDCPGVEYVWLEQPQMFCVACTNRSIGHKWRPVVVPRNHREIESLLLARPDPMTRNWSPGETAEQLQADNAVLGV